ncbi:hypothetical protein AC579_6374 [Pseudocercospora musae]|uniref:Uncharacterized protein n=1 Tax=Pseudocercospora musae TaxID=113226 RepID=A0A139IJ80_9PEZI|nr:hypothetical protein AC579_6374 [Pseudocercospora musae]
MTLIYLSTSMGSESAVAVFTELLENCLIAGFERMLALFPEAVLCIVEVDAQDDELHVVVFDFLGEVRQVVSVHGRQGVSDEDNLAFVLQLFAGLCNHVNGQGESRDSITGVCLASGQLFSQSSNVAHGDLGKGLQYADIVVAVVLEGQLVVCAVCSESNDSSHCQLPAGLHCRCDVVPKVFERPFEVGMRAAVGALAH